MEYKDFSPKVFCGHVHQKKRAQWEKPYWIPKRNRGTLHTYLKEAKAEKSEFDSHHFIGELEGLNNLLFNLDGLN